MMKLKDGRAPRAFTLIELLTVIAILGILAAILIPVVASVRDSARTANCVSNLRQVGSTVYQWSQENSDRLPPVSQNQNNFLGLEHYRWHEDLIEYAMGISLENLWFSNAGAENVFVCPTAYMEYAGSPGFRADRQGYTYGMSRYSNGGFHPWPTLPANRTITDFRSPSLTALFMDGSYASGAGHWVNDVSKDPGNEWYPQFLHNGSINVLYVDGHVERVAEADYPDDAADAFWDDPRLW